MRSARRTFAGAFHHGMNRGYEGRAVFRDDQDKSLFLELLVKVQKLTRVRVLAFCVLDNHYHLVMQNTTGKMPGFFKQLNGQYAVYFRKRYGGKGYVFQDRYKSMLVQDDSYLKIGIAYVLGNPVKAGLVKRFDLYPWSSGSLYFKRKASDGAVDLVFVEELFGSKKELKHLVNSMEELPIVQSELGPVIGGEEFIERAAQMAERRTGKESMERRRAPDKYFESTEKIFKKLEKKYKVNLMEVDMHTHAGKRLRAEMLVHLRERAGMTYREIAQMDVFADLGMNSLGTLYQRNRKRLQTGRNDPK